MSLKDDLCDLIYNICAIGVQYIYHKSYFEDNEKTIDIVKNIGFHKRFSKEFNMQKFDSYNYNTKKYDNVIRKYVSIRTLENEIIRPTRLYIKGDLNMMSNMKTITIYNSGHEIYTYPLQLLFNTNKIMEKESLDESDDFIKINISHFPYLFSPSVIGDILFHIDFYDDFLNHEDLSVSIMMNITVMEDMTLLKNSDILQIVNRIKYMQFDFEETNEIKLCLNKFSNLSNGLFIYGDINDIIKITVHLKELQLEYPKVVIDSMCDKISDKVLFLPFSSTSEYNIMTPESYLNGVEFSRYDVDEVYIEFLFKQKKDNITVYNNGINILRHKIGGFGDPLCGFLGGYAHSD